MTKYLYTTQISDYKEINLLQSLISTFRYQTELTKQIRVGLFCLIPKEPLITPKRFCLTFQHLVLHFFEYSLKKMPRVFLYVYIRPCQENDKDTVRTVFMYEIVSFVKIPQLTKNYKKSNWGRGHFRFFQKSVVMSFWMCFLCAWKLGACLNG